MRRNFLMILAAMVPASLWSATPSGATALTAEDRERGMQYLQESRNCVIGATKGLSEAQWKFKPSPDRWSIAEIVEHLALAEDYLMGQVREQLQKAPVAPASRDAKPMDALILTMVPDRSKKFQAPPPLTPTGRWTPAGALDHLLTTRARTIEFLQSSPDLRGHLVDFPPLGQPVDGYEWLLAASGHVARHTKQILEVKADANFPPN